VKKLIKSLQAARGYASPRQQREPDARSIG
jgi:hypothetical protein